jgi:hypothetical protein
MYCAKLLLLVIGKFWARGFTVNGDGSETETPWDLFVGIWVWALWGPRVSAAQLDFSKDLFSSSSFL